MRISSGEVDNAFRDHGQRTPTEQELYELCQQVKQLEEERALLKKRQRNNA
jgi:hypothetical protein